MRSLLAVVAALLVMTGTASADKVDERVEQLRKATTYKVRLSAALSLANTNDPRAIDAMIRALAEDDTATVRRVAAVGLGKMIDDRTPPRLRRRAERALANAAKRDRDANVRKSAARSARLLQRRDAPKAPAVFIAVATPSDGSKQADKQVIGELERTIRATLGRAAPTYALSWTSGGLPSQADLRQAGTKAFYVGATVVKIEIARKGSSAEVRCTVSMQVNPWNGRDGQEKWEAHNSASASGNAKVIGPGSAKGIRTSVQDCILAVSEQITVRQVVPFIQRLVASN